MAERGEVYVVAVLGERPAAATELLWHLVAREGRRVTGVELWTHDRGRARLRERGEALFAGLRRVLGPAADHVPAWGAPVAVYSGTDRVPGRGVSVFVPRGADGHGPEDVTTPEEARVFARWAHRRFAALGDVREPIVCAIAGARQGRSALAQSAFTLAARPIDRLVHVAPGPIAEASVDRSPFPRPAPGVDPAAEPAVHVFDVPVFSVRAFVDGPGRRTADDLRAAIGQGLARATAAATGPTLTMRRIARQRVEISLGREAFTCSLPYAVAYVLLLETPEGLGPSRLMRDAHHATGGVGALDPESVARSLRNLRRRFERAAGRDVGLRSLVPRIRNETWAVAPEPGVDLDVPALRRALALTAR